VTIIDFNGDILFSGESELSPEVVLSSQIQSGKETAGNNTSLLSGSRDKVREKENSVLNVLSKYYWILPLALAPLLFYTALSWFRSRKQVTSFTNLRKNQSEFESVKIKKELDDEFEKIQNSDTETYFELLKDESPHNIAVILSQIPNDKGADILNWLPAEKRGEVAVSLSRVEQISPEVKKRVWQAFESLLKSESKHASSHQQKDEMETGKTEVLHSKY
jgi:hypothetical protein